MGKGGVWFFPLLQESCFTPLLFLYLFCIFQVLHSSCKHHLNKFPLARSMQPQVFSSAGFCWLLMTERPVTCQLDALEVEGVLTRLPTSLSLSIFGDTKMLCIHLWRYSSPDWMWSWTT